jgi:hypothetical protein
MRMAQILAGVVLLASLTIRPAFADQHGHSTSTPHANPNPHATPRTPATPTVGEHATETHSRPHAREPRRASEHGRATTTTTTAANPIAAKISQHPQLASRVGRMLPAGMTLATASRGFRNQGQFIAALHVSQNLHIPFADLKRAMTGPNAMSLGQAIHALRPSTDSDGAVRRANTQTSSDLR